MKLNLKRKLKAFMNKIYKTSTDNILFDCFPKISKEEAKELENYIEQKFKNNEKGWKMAFFSTFSMDVFKKALYNKYKIN